MESVMRSLQEIHEGAKEGLLCFSGEEIGHGVLTISMVLIMWGLLGLVLR